jgi:hypothetical protein
VKRIVLAVLLCSVVALSAAGLATARGPIGPTVADVIGPVRIDPSDPTVGYVTALYACNGGQTDQTHLWVSVKQNADRTVDQALTQEGSSQVAAAWSQSHPTDITCDGRFHIQTFRVDHAEQGFGALANGFGYVQFCLFGGDGVYGASQIFLPVTSGNTPWWWGLFGF